MDDPVSSSDAPPLLVYCGQQICPDYPASVVAKIRTLAALGESHPIRPTLVWADTDRSGSEKAITTIRWPLRERVASVSLAPRSTRNAEIRFVQPDGAALRQSWERLGAWLAQSVEESEVRKEATARHGAIARQLNGAKTLAEVNHTLTTVLLREALDVSLPSVFVSSLVERGALTPSLEQVITHIDDFVAAFNEGVERLGALGVNAHLTPREPDYLPLYYSCPEHNQRVRLVHVRSGRDSLAVADCPEHGSHRFDLGRDQKSLAELEVTGRWSPDVTLPIHLDGLVSGVVAGRSSALYGIVLGWAQRTVLGTQPNPVLVPDELSRPAPEGAVDSLLFAYLTGQTP